MSDFENMDEWDIDRGLPRRRSSVEGRPQADRRSRQVSEGISRERRNAAGRQPYGVNQPYGIKQPSSVRNSRRKKQQRRRKIVLTIVLTLAVIGLIGVAVYIIMQHLPVSTGSKGSETVYSREVDATDALCGNMAVWLSTIDGTSIDTAWVKDRCNEKFTVIFELTLSGGGKVKNYSEEMNAESYDKLADQVDNTLEDILSEIIAEKLMDAGYAESVQPSEAKSLAQQILGVNVSEYIKENGVNLVPSSEEMEHMYSIGKGSYRMSKGQMNFSPEDGKPFSETVIQKKNTMVLTDSNIVYEKAE